MSNHIIQQTGIIVFGGLAIFLVGSRKEKVRKWAYLVGLISQPFFIWAEVSYSLWGSLVLSVWYTFSWMRGIYNHWWRGSDE